MIVNIFMVASPFPSNSKWIFDWQFGPITARTCWWWWRWWLKRWWWSLFSSMPTTFPPRPSSKSLAAPHPDLLRAPWASSPQSPWSLAPPAGQSQSSKENIRIHLLWHLISDQCSNDWPCPPCGTSYKPPSSSNSPPRARSSQLQSVLVYLQNIIIIMINSQNIILMIFFNLMMKIATTTFSNPTTNSFLLSWAHLLLRTESSEDQVRKSLEFKFLFMRGTADYYKM